MYKVSSVPSTFFAGAQYNLLAMSDNRLIAALPISGAITLMKSTNKGVNWSQIQSISPAAAPSTGNGSLIELDGKIGIIYHPSASETVFRVYSVDGVLIKETILESGVTQSNKGYVTQDPITGHLHAVWTSYGQLYGAKNIRYSYSTDMGESWNVAAYIAANTSNQDYKVTVSAHSNNIAVFSSYSGYAQIHAKLAGETSFSRKKLYSIANGSSYVDSTVDSTGKFHFVLSTGVGWVSYFNSTTDFAATLPGTLPQTGIATGASIVVDDQDRLYLIYHSDSVVRIKISTNGGADWTADYAEISTAATSFSAINTTGVKVKINEIPPILFSTSTGTHYTGDYSVNAVPTVSLNTPNNQTLYENDTFTIDGTVLDSDVGDTVTVRYQIGAGTVRAIKAYLSTGALESFGKQLTFKGGNLSDGETLIASDLTDGKAHTLKVYATDDKGGTSSIIERTFYVVPNRVPLLTVNTPIIEGNINADLINVNGTFSDPDANNAIVSYRINGSSSVQIAEGTSGVFDFSVSFGQLKLGENVITIEVIDSYGAKTTKTIKLNKKAIETPLLNSTQRYQLLPPSGSAAGVLFYIQRDAALDMDVSISMTQAVEAEQYVQLEPMTTAPISQGSSIVEDEYYYAASDPAEKILLQIDFTRTSLTADEKIYVVMGAFE